MPCQPWQRRYCSARCCTSTIGTSGAVRMTAGEVHPDDAQRVFTYLLTKDIYITGGAINNGGIVAEWLSGMLLNDATPKDPDELLQLAATAPPGAGNLLFLPYLLGERGTHVGCKCKRRFVWINTTTYKGAHCTRRHRRRVFCHAKCDGCH